MRDCRQHQQGDHVERNAQHRSCAEQVPNRTAAGHAGKLVRVGSRQLVVQRAHHDERDQGGEKGSRLAIGNQRTIHCTYSRPETDNAQDRQRQFETQDLERIEREEVRHREHGADGQIDATRQHGHGHRSGDHRGLRKIGAQLLEVANAAVARNGECKCQKDGNHERERNDRLHPTLLKQFAKEDLRRVPVPEAQHSLHRGERLDGGTGAAGSLPGATAVRERPTWRQSWAP